ncbi:MAG: YcnI family protein [Arthrobacter sp.]
MLIGLSGASAHVGVTPDKTAANSYSLLTFGIPHGCGDSSTTKVTITLPAELDDAQPTVNPNWTAEKVTEQLAEPKKIADGASITKRTSQIVYTAKAPLEPSLRDALVLSVKLPDAVGKTLYFPTLQNCEVGQTDWSELPAEGQDPHSLKAPAPSVTVTAAALHGHEAHAAGAPETAPHSAPATGHAAAVTDDGAQARSWAGLVAGVGGLALGGLALARSRNAKPAPISDSGPALKE